MFGSLMGYRYLSMFLQHSGKKLPEYPAEEDEVLSLLERVSEAKKLSAMVFFYFCIVLNSKGYIYIVLLISVFLCCRT